ncbi:MAG: hypothetical protein FJ270_08530 [Planctomycetes bacterium]|nr:hypothetical protein [Planctomycetota bacterium]
MNSTAAIAVLAVATPALAAEVLVQQVNFSFSPSVVTVNPGDTIKWKWTAGSHTVTSGTSCTASSLFNAPLTSTAQTFIWAVPASAAGTSIPYFCTPHCAVQTGTIIVNVPAIPGDLDGNGHVDGADLGMLLSAWGASGPPDLDGSGTVDGGDLSTLLANWTS